ncbi:MAG: exo-alpha-sialidase, partial [Ignavibacteriae bacterium]
MNPFATRVLALTSTFFIAGIVASAQMLMPTAMPVGTNASLVPSATSVNRIIEQPMVDGSSITVATSPVLRPASTPKVVAMPQEAPRGAMVGYTYYDFQTNASMARRVTYHEDGADKYVQIVWMASKDPTRDPVSRAPGFNPARGSHYNFLDVNEPDFPVAGIEDWKKMESERAGWPSLVQFDDGSVGTPSHTPIRFYRNAGVGDDQFFEFAQVTTTADSALWPRAAVDGENNIHLIYNRTLPNNGGTQVAYRRSTDGGSTWEPEILFTGQQALLPQGVTGPLPNGTGGDTYAITARGPNVVVAYTDSPLRCLTRKSTDYGRTWDDPNVGIRVIVGQNQTYIDSTEFANGDSIRVYTDTVPSPSSHISIVLDSEGLAHYAIGQTLTYVIQTGP